MWLISVHTKAVNIFHMSSFGVKQREGKHMLEYIMSLVCSYIVRLRFVRSGVMWALLWLCIPK